MYPGICGKGLAVRIPLFCLILFFKHIFGRLQYVQWPSLSSLCLLRSQDRVFILLIQTTFSGIRPKAFCYAHTHALPPAKVYFPAIKFGMDSHRLIDDKAHLWSASRSAGRGWQWQFHWSHWGPSRPPFCLSRDHLKKQASPEAWAYSWL